jgi:hypothetical protein
MALKLKILFFALGLLLVNRAIIAAPTPPKKPEQFDTALFEVPPKPTKVVEPVYPYNQSRAGVDGVVVVDFVIIRRGRSKIHM